MSDFFAAYGPDGEIVWEGFVENPTPTPWDVTAVGGMVLASDDTPPLIFVDHGLDGWRRGDHL